jgi:hypothetical protein
MIRKAVLPLLCCIFGWSQMLAADVHPPADIIHLQEVICSGQSYSLGSQTFTATGTYNVSVYENGQWVDYRLDLTVLHPDAAWTGDTQLHCDRPSVTLQASGGTGPGTISYKWERQTGEYTVDNISFAPSVSIVQTGTYYLQVTQQYQGVYCADRSWAIPVGVETRVTERYDTIAPGETIFIQGDAITEAGVYEWTVTTSPTCIQLIRAHITELDPPPPTATCRSSLTVDLNNQCWTEVTKEQVITSGMDQVASLVMQDHYPYNEGFVEGPGIFWAEAYSAENELLCHTQVTVRDVTAPVILPRAAELMLEPAGSTAINPWALVDDAYDACSSISLTASPPEFTLADLGHRTVELTATDEAGHQTRVTTTVSVVPPVCLPDLRWTYPLTSGTYRAAGDIVLSAPLDSAAAVVLEGQSITLAPGFRTGNGCTLRASARPCGDGEMWGLGDGEKGGVGERESWGIGEDRGVFLSVFPNPVVGNGTIRLQLSEPQSIKIYLVDALGRPVHTFDFGARRDAGVFTYSIKPDVFPGGWYVLIAHTGSGVIQEKILIR